MNANSVDETILVVRISTPRAVAGLGLAYPQRRQFEELAFVQALLVRSEDCRGTRVDGDELVGLFPGADAAFEAACALQRTCAEPGRSPTLAHLRMLLDDPSAISRDAEPPARASDRQDRLIRQLPPDRIFATPVVAARFSAEIRAKFRLFEHDTVDDPNLGHLYQAICDEEAVTRLAIPAPNQDTAKSACCLHLRWRENTITLQPDGPTLTLGRGDQSDIQIESELASRVHATLRFQQTNFILTDQSTNGTFVQIDNDDEVHLHHEQIVLRGSGVISLGRRMRAGRGKVIYFVVTKSGR